MSAGGAVEEPLTRRQRRKARRRGRRRRNPVWRWRRWMFALVLLVIGATAGAVFVLAQIPLPPARSFAQTSFVYSADGTLLGEMHGEQDRVEVPLSAMAPVLIDAVIAAEDRDFFNHQGVDPFGIARALWADLRDEGAQQGASTITQQYVKNAYLTPERTWSRKIREAVLAVRLEREMTKEEILERYLNVAYFGRGAYGAQAASRAYFDKDVSELSLAEAALLVGLVRSPETADPTRSPDVAARRLESVLDAMVLTGTATEAEADVARSIPFEFYVLARPPANEDLTVAVEGIGIEYYLDHVRRYLLDRYGAEAVYEGGLRVVTSIDLDLQADAFAATCGYLDQPDDPSAALVAIDEGGRVVAMAGGCDHDASQVNLATGRAGGGTGRQAGSAFKPFVLAEALRAGLSVESTLPAPPEVVLPEANDGADWVVRNYEGAAQGELGLVDATVRSSNTVYAQLIAALPDGPTRVAALAREMGVASPLNPVMSITLGTPLVSVLDMAAGYSTFANRGLAVEPRFVLRVEDRRGRVLEDNQPTGIRVLDEPVADMVTAVLEQAVAVGTGQAADPGFPVAGKTGTTQAYGDAWFAGYAPRLTAAVWVGYPEGQQRTMESVRGERVAGGTIPARIWREFMLSASARLGDLGSFPPVPLPAGVPLGAVTPLLVDDDGRLDVMAMREAETVDAPVVIPVGLG